MWVLISAGFVELASVFGMFYFYHKASAEERRPGSEMSTAKFAAFVTATFLCAVVAILTPWCTVFSLIDSHRTAQTAQSK